MTSPNKVPKFSGETGKDGQPGDFLKEFRISVRPIPNMTAAEKIESFGDHLKTGSPAEEWFQDTTTPKGSWALFEAAFIARFPGIPKAKKTGVDLERELLSMRLEVEDLGKTESFGGDNVWTHIAFAEKALDLARRAKIDTGSSSIWTVCDNLPDIIKDKVSETQATWTTFCQAIKDVDLGHIRDGVKKHKERVAERNAIALRISRLEGGRTIPASPTAGIRNQMSKTTISTSPAATPNQTNITQQNTFGGTGGGRGNLFTPNGQRPPATEAEKDALRKVIETYPLQDDTPAGRAAYLEQCRAWGRLYSTNQKVTDKTGFPLKPGTAPVSSGECYGCGRTGHNRQQCPAPANEQLNIREGNWRAICGRVLGRNSASHAAPVNFVREDTDEFAWMHTAGTGDFVAQGNGMGPSA